MYECGACKEKSNKWETDCLHCDRDITMPEFAFYFIVNESGIGGYCLCGECLKIQINRYLQNIEDGSSMLKKLLDSKKI